MGTSQCLSCHFIQFKCVVCSCKNVNLTIMFFFFFFSLVYLTKNQIKLITQLINGKQHTCVSILTPIKRWLMWLLINSNFFVYWKHTVQFDWRHSKCSVNYRFNNMSKNSSELDPLTLNGTCFIAVHSLIPCLSNYKT